MKNLRILAIALLAFSCGPEVRKSSIDEATTKKVLDHHLKTFQANDLEGVMADYVEESILITPDRTYKGLSEIRENFVQAYKALPSKGTTMTITKSVVSKNVAYIVWKAISPTLEFKYATDTFIIVDGKIVSQTFAGVVVPTTQNSAK